MAAVIAAMRHTESIRRKPQNSASPMSQSDRQDQAIRSGALETWGNTDMAAISLQRCVRNRLLGKGIRLRRRPLLERMSLELELMIGLRMLVLCAVMFFVVIFAAILESQGPRRLGLLSTYQSLFQLDDSLADINTAEDLFDLLRSVSENSRRVMPVSSDNFVEESGEVKLLLGKRRFRRTLLFNNEDVDPRISSPSFTFTVWTKAQPGEGGIIIRKPLGDSIIEQDLSCWSWYEGFPSSRFIFGAHDFRGGAFQQASDLEESAIGTHESLADDGKWHLLSVVVEPSSVSFYQDAALRSSVPILRPVTDCSGRLLHIGSPGLPRMGELTFFARSLSTSEMLEIAVTGFTLQSLAAGKIPFTPSPSDVDDVKSSMETEFAAAESRSSLLDDALRVESTLSRGIVTSSFSPPTPPQVQPAPRPPLVPGCERDRWFGGSGCHGIQDVPQSARNDSGGNTYYELMPPSVRGGAGHDQRLHVDWAEAGGYVWYDPVTFPSFCGGSASFTFWARSDMPIHPGYLIRKYDRDGSPYSIFLAIDGIEAYGYAMSSNGLIVQFPGKVGTIFSQAPATAGMRHVSVVFDVGCNCMRVHLDGEFVGEQGLPRSVFDFARMDCLERREEDYISLFHRQPGAWTFKGDIQDFRYYPNVSLTDDEIHTIAFPPKDDQTVGPQRTCETNAEGGDTTYTDVMGHPCSWYQAMRESVPTLCLDPEVRAGCPLACQSVPSCHEYEGGAQAEQHAVFERVMHITEKRRHEGTLCVREGLDVVGACRTLAAQRDPRSYPPGWEGPYDGTGLFTPDSTWPGWHRMYIPQADINVTDCDLLERVVDPFCAFSVPDSWTAGFHAKVAASNEMTVIMWIKVLGGDIQPSLASLTSSEWEEYPRRIRFLSHVAPPRTMLEIALMRNGPQFNIVFPRYPALNWREEVTPSVELDTDRWIHLALAIGLTDPVLFDQLVQDGEEFQWTVPTEGDGEFLQAVQLPGNVLVSPVLFSAVARTQKELQAEYYQTKNAQAVRRGPRVTDQERLVERIEYERPVYPYPLLLVAPPVLLQQRAKASPTCTHQLGSDYLEQLWRQTVEGVTCLRPYQCPDDVLSDPGGLMACSSSSEVPELFFGQRALALEGELQFAEFLQSVADASILVRGDEAWETENYLDGLTTAVTVAMVAFSPNYGIASTIRITARFETDVKVDFSVEHFQSLEGDDLRWYGVVAFTGIGLAVIILAEKAYTTWARVRAGLDVNVMLLAADVLVQVVLPLVYFSLRYTQRAASKNDIAATVGSEGLAGVPWASTEVAMGDKMTQFFEGLEAFSAQIAQERVMQVFYFAHATVCLLRLIAQTSIHPRLSILVGTIRNAAADLWHFLLLLLVLYGGFLALAMAQFSGRRDDFATPLSTFETLYDMMLGSLPESGEIPSQFWAFDPLIMVFAITYNFLVFMIMLNFIIAIIVEAYMKVVEEIQNNEAEQEFFTDCFSVVLVHTKGLLRGWPAHGDLMESMKGTIKNSVGYAELRKLYPAWRAASLRSFLEHYTRYEVMDPKSTPRQQEHRYNYIVPDNGGPSSDDLKLCDAVDEVEKRVALLLKAPVPSLAEKVLAQKAIDVQSGKHKRRKGQRNKTNITNTNAPAAAGGGVARDLGGVLQGGIAGAGSGEGVEGKDVEARLAAIEGSLSHLTHLVSSLVANNNNNRTGGSAVPFVRHAQRVPLHHSFNGDGTAPEYLNGHGDAGRSAGLPPQFWGARPLEPDLEVSPDWVNPAWTGWGTA